MDNIEKYGTPFIRNHFSKSIQCDICFKLCDSFDTGLSCRDNNIDICDNCIIKINTKLYRFISNKCDVKLFTTKKGYKCDYCNKLKINILFHIKENNKKDIFICRNCILTKIN